MADQPNIVLILADDLGWRDLSCYGSTFYETPNIDRLAADGMLFSDAYAAAPVCSPTRASMLTGKYPARVGVTQYIGGHVVGRLCDVPYFRSLPANEFSLARALRRGGYKTWHVGKWHLGSKEFWPDRHGFDVNVAGCDWGQPAGGYFSPYGCPTLTDGPVGEYLTDRLTDEAIRLMRSVSPDEPFFLSYWPYAVHIPIEAPPALVEKYRRKARELGLDEINPFEVGEALQFWQRRDLHVRRRKIQSSPEYAAMIENLDWNIGRLMDELDRSGHASNTMFIFTSDNGGVSSAEGSPTSNAPLSEGKGWMYDGGVREPLIIRWPDMIAAGTTTAEPITTPDFYPTLLEAAGLPLEPQQHVDGKSFLSLLRGEQFSRGPLYWHYPHYSNQGGEPAACVRDGKWKLIKFFDGNRFELYNLADDLSEEHDLALKEPEIVTRLTGALDEWSVSVGCLIPRRNAYAEPFEDFPGDQRSPGARLSYNGNWDLA